MKKLSIIIPVYNEENTIKEILNKVVSVKITLKKEIICIDDGSIDNSANIIKKLIKRKGKDNIDIKYFYKENMGKGSAIRLGFKKATGDVFIIQDADLEYNPEDYNKLLELIIKKKFKVVYGSRYLSPETGHFKEHNHLTYEIHKIGNRFLSLITSILYGTRITDMETCYKVFTREVYDKLNLHSNDFAIEPEITSKILKKGYKIKELDISYFSRDFKEGKKITWKDGVKALFYLIKYRFVDWFYRTIIYLKQKIFVLREWQEQEITKLNGNILS